MKNATFEKRKNILLCDLQFVFEGVTDRSGDDIPEPLTVETIIIHPEWGR